MPILQFPTQATDPAHVTPPSGGLTLNVAYCPEPARGERIVVADIVTGTRRRHPVNVNKGYSADI
jgi:hypothetical protein